MRTIILAAAAAFFTIPALAATNTPQVPAPALTPATISKAAFCDPQMDMSNWRHASKCADYIGEVVSYSETVSIHDVLEDGSGPEVRAEREAREAAKEAAAE